ncbi:methionine synthase reductase isoform X2 [Aethina tumida]|uniref:methionine synthase reductase isoform X2 n=1 Tax=Aethina tumida TaxID=116153 RepID=UPI0021473035|nr:methionine synthase reductase isoform X2 [Aethina tumida]
MGDLIKLDILDNIYTDKCNFNQKLLPFATSGVILATVKSAVILSQGDDVKTVYDLSLSLEEKHEYLPGDTIGIIPKNDAIEVEQLLSRLNVLHVADYECNLSISEKTTKKNPSLPKHIPTVRSLRTIFLNDIDLRSPPKKLFLKALLKYTSNPDEIQRLEHLTSTAGSKDYINFISTEGRTLLKLLQAFPSCNPPIEIILEHSVMLQARPYSISSSPLADDYLHVTFFIVENSDGSKGVCTGWLENLINQGGYRKLPIYFRKPTDFRIQADLSVPTIMIGTGTGEHVISQLADTWMSL